MKNLFIALFAGICGLTVVVADAEAKRLGGGKSVGIQRDQPMKREATPQQAPAASTQQAAPAAGAAAKAATPAASGMSRWLGPLAGLAAGLGLAALFSHLGLSEAFGSFLLMALIAIAVVFLVRLFFRRSAAPAQPVQVAGEGPVGSGRFEPIRPAMPAAAPSDRDVKVINGFDVESFVRQAKLNFVRLQAANDAGNIDDIREFSTPEMFAEIKLQIQERGGVVQQTDVVQLNAEVLDVSQEGNRYIASVRFWGSLREEKDAAPASFDETWHLVKPLDGGSGWIIAGIQQSS